MRQPRTARPPRTALLAAATVGVVLVLSACGGSSGSSSGTAATFAAAASEAAPASAPSASAAAAGDQAASGPVTDAQAAGGAAATAAAGSGSGSGSGSGTGTGTGTGQSGTTSSGSNAAAQPKQRLIRTVEITIEVKILGTAASRVRQIASDFGGSVSSETTGYAAASKPVTVLGSDGQPTQRAAVAGQSVIVLRIPEPDLDKALERLGGDTLGKELTRTATSQDVTGDIADATSRVATQKASVARIRELLAKANSLQDITYLESQLTDRESTLEALEARVASLSDRADLATLTVVLQTPEVEPPAPQPVSDNSFLKGLHSGWDAVVASMTVVLTVLGALLPVAVVLVVVGGPVYLLTRRFRRRSAPPAAPRAGGPGGPDAGPWFPGQPAGPSAPAPDDPAGDAPVPVGAGSGTSGGGSGV